MASNTKRVAVSAESLAYLMPELTRPGVLTTNQAVRPNLTPNDQTDTNTSTQQSKDSPSDTATPTSTNHPLSPTPDPEPVIDHVESAGHEGHSACEDQTSRSDLKAHRGADGTDAAAGCLFCQGGKDPMNPANRVLVEFLEIQSLDRIASDIAEERAQILNHLDKVSQLMSSLRAIEKVLRQVSRANAV